ncbi:hypothetical protein P12x_001560 [Tundrisphaera lichenicola]|uniref:hypothetical protein n=1 Tax=Tundrisphaera lichenicola TaxID=2029860 RepID=UPI003EBA0403
MPPMHLHVNLNSLAAILWSGMLIIAGSIWVLSSQVRRLVDHMEEQAKAGEASGRAIRKALNGSTPPVVRRIVEREGTGVH